MRAGYKGQKPEVALYEAPTLYVPPRARTRRTQGSGVVFAVALIILMALDVVSPAGPPLSLATGVAAYAIKTLIGLVVLFVGGWAFVKTALPNSLRLSLVAFTCIVGYWFGVWALSDRQSDAITVLLNPVYSVWAWLFMFTIPCVVMLNGNGSVTRAIGAIPATPATLIALVIAIAFPRLTVQSYGLAVCFILSCKPIGGLLSRLYRILILFVLSASMIIDGSRLYCAAIFLLSLSYVFFRSMSKTVSVGLCVTFLSIPLFYQYIASNYADKIYSRDNPLTFDTRTFLYRELFEDMNHNEILIGRGLQGRYFSPYFQYIAKAEASEIGAANIFRASSEVAPLHLILKFGILGLTIFIINLMIPILFGSPATFVPLDGIRRFIPMMFLIFSGELYNQISAAYFALFIALGTLLSANRWTDEVLVDKSESPE